MNGSSLVSRHRRYIRIFLNAEATDPEHAKDLSEIGCPDTRIFQRLASRGVFIQLGDGRYYMDEMRAKDFFYRRRRIIVNVVFISFLVIIVLIIISKIIF